MTIDIYTILTWLAVAIVSSLGIVIYLGSNKLSTRAFVIMLITTVIWGIDVSLVRSVAGDSLITEFFMRSTYFVGGVISACFLYFCLTFPEDKRVSWRVTAGLIIVELAFIPLYYSNLIVYGHFYIGGVQMWFWHFGPLAFLFDVFFDAFWVAGFYILYTKYKNYPEGSVRTNLKLMFWGMLIGVVPPTFVNIILPRLGYPNWDWFGPVSSLGWVAQLSYSIIKYRQMNVKAIAAEVFVLAMSILLFANIFVGEASVGVASKVVIFITFIAVGYLFIRSMLREADQKEQLKDLNQNLSDKVVKLDEKTTELNKRLAEIERMNRYMIDRELKMVELKKENEELRAKVG